MAASSASSSPPPSTEERLREDQPPPAEHQQQQTAIEKDCIHKTKLVQFLGRATPIVLQNDNGPCPLLAICNVLLLRNNLKLSPDTTEVSQEKLLSLVAERLIDSNSNINDKDVGYIENQQQNISDAIDLLPRLTTGIDVNIKFRRIGDFEFTPECAIFDLLDIPLYHGWIVDPQDKDTADAIADKSYNTIMGELVALETQAPGKESEIPPQEDSVDFAAATTAALGVPSPCLSKVRSFNDPSPPVADDHVMKKGDLEEEAELLRALKLSVADAPNASGPSPIVGNEENNVSVSPLNTENAEICESENVKLEDSRCVESNCHKELASELNTSDALKDPDGIVSSVVPVDEAVPSFPSVHFRDHSDQSKQEKLGEALPSGAAESIESVDSLIHIEDASVIAKQCELTVDMKQDPLIETEVVKSSSAYYVEQAKTLENSTGQSSTSAGSDSSCARLQHINENDTFNPVIDDGEPLYEGEERILDSQPMHFEDREPMYEGEVVLAKQADKSTASACAVGSNIDITPQQGELIRNFLKNNASQLTFYGIFSLQEGLKERELCVFFRNNHFSTMFKYEGQLYLLATDQGYINQSDLVWEKLNEVNGDTLFMTGNFKEFNVENQSSGLWDEQNAMATTADYLASIDGATQDSPDANSDLQLAIALQQQEFEQQQQRQGSQQTQSTGSSRLYTGPQVPRNGTRHTSSSSAHPEAKQKDKCSIM